MKRFVEGTDRGQSTLFPECLEDWIDENNSVQVIDVFVDQLDLAELGFDGVAPEVTGRPAYHPSVLLKLYIYGYLNRVQSSRRLERVWFNSARVWLARFPLYLIQLAMRIAVGAVFFNSGLLKINSWEFAIKLFQDEYDEYKVPLLDPVWAARLATFNELTFSVLLIIGLAMRIATLPLLGMIAVIQTFVYPQAWTGVPADPGTR